MVALILIVRTIVARIYRCLYWQICTPEKWDLISRGWCGVSNDFSSSSASNGKRFVREVGLLIIDEIHLLGEERGAVLEAIVSRTRFISKFNQASSSSLSEGKAIETTRIIGLSTALANPYDLADWIGIDTQGYGVDAKRGLYNFRPSVRPVPMVVHIQGYPGRHVSDLPARYLCSFILLYSP